MFEEFKNELLNNGNSIKDFTLLVKYSHCTNNGDFINKYILLKNKNNTLENVSHLLKNIKSIRINKKMEYVAGDQLDGYLKYYVPELNQIKL